MMSCGQYVQKESAGSRASVSAASGSQSVSIALLVARLAQALLSRAVLALAHPAAPLAQALKALEDNGLLDECWLAGEGDRQKLADGSYELFFRSHPHETDREYLKFVFKEVGKLEIGVGNRCTRRTPTLTRWPATSGSCSCSLLVRVTSISAGPACPGSPTADSIADSCGARLVFW